MSRNNIAVIIEGAVYEKKLINSIRRHFFRGDNKTEYTVIPLPMSANLYILWKELRTDENLDIIELVRERNAEAARALEGKTRNDFSEVYMFFDYDKQQKNLPITDDVNQVLSQMLHTFNNETENGKLYISYPMAEAIRDAVPGSCKAFSESCYYNSIGSDYKTITGGNNNPLSHIGTYTVNRWADFINTYRGRLTCLIGNDELLTIADCKNYSTWQIYKLQKQSENNIGTVVLSAFAEFLIDYFNEDYLCEIIKLREFSFVNCKSKRIQP